MKTLLVMSNSTDVRSFCFSGLAAQLAQYTPVAFGLSSEHQMSGIPAGSSWTLATGAPWKLPTALSYLRRAGEAVTREEVAREGQNVWINFHAAGAEASPARRIREALKAALPACGKGIVAAERALFASYPCSRKLGSYLEREEIGTAILSSMASERDVEVIRTCKALGVLTIVALNSPKDAFSRPHVSVWPDHVFAPNRQALDHLIRFNGKPRETTRLASGPSLHLSSLRACCEQALDRATFCSLYHFDPLRPVVCYSAGAPAAVQHELQIVADLVEGLRKLEWPSAPQVLIRLNPMEDRPERWNALCAHGDVAVQVPRWKWIPEDLWSEPLPEDGGLWVSTLRHCICNVSIPSTVTSEFLEFGKPVLNVCFDHSTSATQGAERSNLRYWNAGFYQECRDSPLVHPARTPDELLMLLRAVVRFEIRGVSGTGELRREPSTLHRIVELVKSRAVVDARHAAGSSPFRLPA